MSRRSWLLITGLAVGCGELPTWDEVKSGHPEGATNPPTPELVVTPEGDCYKNWRSGMAAPTREEPRGLTIYASVGNDRIQDCEGVDCGTLIQCPQERKKDLQRALELATYEENFPEGPPTNPPAPRLAVSEDGRCFEAEDGGENAVESCPAEEVDNPCGQPIECPPEAAELLAEHAELQTMPPSISKNPPGQIPQLVVATDGRCFQGPGYDADVVKVCGPEEQDNACGEPIACPPHAATLLAEYNEPPTRTNNPPPTGR